ncbi:MAG: hypothetical protein OEY24_04370 [Candidatus Bathyarchaeota archaeon]|nr:hypothetical protein [Candidatus Bathyarchaeota archaeon]
MAKQTGLSEFFKSTLTTLEKKKKESTIQVSETREKRETREKVLKQEDPKQLPPSYFVSASYDGKRGIGFIKLYEPKSKRIYLWHDTLDINHTC